MKFDYPIQMTLQRHSGGAPVKREAQTNEQAQPGAQREPAAPGSETQAIFSARR